MTEPTNYVVERARQTLAGVAPGRCSAVEVARYQDWLEGGGPGDLLAEVERLRTDLARMTEQAEASILELRDVTRELDAVHGDLAEAHAEVRELREQLDRALREHAVVRADRRDIAAHAITTLEELAEAHASYAALTADAIRQKRRENEARTVINRVRKLAEEWERGGIEGPHPVDRASAAQLRRALEGEVSGE